MRLGGRGYDREYGRGITLEAWLTNGDATAHDGGLGIDGSGVWFVWVRLARHGAQDVDGDDELALLATGFTHCALHPSHAHSRDRAYLEQLKPDRIRTDAQTRDTTVPASPNAAQPVHQRVGSRGEPQTRLVGLEGCGRESIYEDIELRLLFLKI